MLAAPGQEVITSDGISIKLSLAAQYRIVDPVVAFNHKQDYLGATYSLLQVALREVVGGKAIDDVLQHREVIGPEVLTRTTAKARSFGVEVTEVEVKDVMFRGHEAALRPGHRAGQQGLASLEGPRRDRRAPKPGERGPARRGQPVAAPASAPPPAGGHVGEHRRPRDAAGRRTDPTEPEAQGRRSASVGD
jgi:hypothetical protein